MNKYIIGAVAVGVILIALSYLYAPEQKETVSSAEPVNSRIVVTGDRHDFGQIDIFGGTVQTEYTLRNEGPDAVTITDAVTSCMCTEGEIAGYTFGMHEGSVQSVVIPAGGEETVRATFDPLAHGPNATGKITRELMLKTNSQAVPVIRLMFSGDVVKFKSSDE